MTRTFDYAPVDRILDNYPRSELSTIAILQDIQEVKMDLDLRGMTAALRLMTDGMGAKDAVDIGITNKCFDEYEHQLVADVVMTRFG